MLGYVLAEEAWGHGYATEAAKRVIAFAFEEMGLEAVSVCHFPFNVRSRRVIENAVSNMKAHSAGRTGDMMTLCSTPVAIPFCGRNTLRRRRALSESAGESHFPPQRKTYHRYQ